MNRDVAVVYLSWLPYGIDHLKRFIASYKEYNSGSEHQLVILFNGVSIDDHLSDFMDYASQNLNKFDVLTMDDGQDIDAYFFAASKLKNKYVLFLNTYSELQAENWLQYYLNAFTKKNVGLVGATGSNQSLFNTVYQSTKWYWEASKGFVYNYRKYKMYIKALVYWRLLIKPFPNPHIRTNGFMISREMFLSLRKRSLKKKFDAYLFESGKDSMTNQVLKKGLDVLIIDKEGKTYEMAAWKESLTYWIDDQKNLLIKDNQTKTYDTSDDEYRKLLTYMCWGLK